MNPLSKFARWYFTKENLPYWMILLLDCVIVFVSSLLVLMLEHGIEDTLMNVVPVTGTLLLYMVFYLVAFRVFHLVAFRVFHLVAFRVFHLVAFRVFHTYKGIIRYSSFVDLQRIGFAMLLGVVLDAAEA